MSMIIAAMPAHNEDERIAKVVLGAKKHVDKVVVVDDGSTDATVKIAEALGALVVRHEGNRGYGAALGTCFETARKLNADIMVILDSDGQHDPAYIPEFINQFVALIHPIAVRISIDKHLQFGNCIVCIGLIKFVVRRL